MPRFSVEKKKTLRNFYDDRFHKSETKFIHTISQVIHLFNESHTNLIEVLAWHLWDNKGSDEQFTMSEKITMEQALKVPREGNDKLVDSLYKKLVGKIITRCILTQRYEMKIY